MDMLRQFWQFFDDITDGHAIEVVVHVVLAASFFSLVSYFLRAVVPQ